MHKQDLEDLVIGAVRHVLETHSDFTEERIQDIAYELRVAFREELQSEPNAAAREVV